MKHPDEQSIVMHALGASGDDAEMTAHLRGCAECRARVAEVDSVLRATADLEVPEPDAGFEARVWQRQRQHLRTAGLVRSQRAPRRDTEQSAPRSVPEARGGRPRWLLSVSLARVAALGAVAATVVVALLVGLYSSPPGTEIVPEGSARGGDRILLVAVGDHLQSARMVLVELVNAADSERVDISAQQRRAQALLADNRLYRQTARLSGENGVAQVLDELERVLLEVARSSGEVPGDELAWLQHRIAEGDLLFKVNVVEARARHDAGMDARGTL